LAALHGEHVACSFLGLDLLGQARIVHILALDAGRDLLDHVLIVADILLDLAGMEVEIEHAMRECIQEVGVVGDDQTGLLIMIRNWVRCSMPAL